MSRPYSRIIEAVAGIASKLGASVTSKGDRLADNLEAIANTNIGTFPAEPEENGAYVLTATKTAEGVTYSWESATN